jgi:hypothetical protein
MINTQGYITKAGVPIIIAGKGGNNATTSSSGGQGIVLQANASPNGTFILNQPTHTTLKVQGNLITQVKFSHFLIYFKGRLMFIFMLLYYI